MLYRREVRWQRNAKIFRTEGWKELLPELRCKFWFVGVYVLVCAHYRPYLVYETLLNPKKWSAKAEKVCCFVSVNVAVVSEWSGGHGEYRRGPAPPQWPAGGQKGVGPGDQQPQTADGGRRSSCCQNQGKDDPEGAHMSGKKNIPCLEANYFRRIDCVDGVSGQRRTLIISELENHGALETPLHKQVENLETEIALRWETEQLRLHKFHWTGDGPFNSSVSWSRWLNGPLQERADRRPSAESPCCWQRGSSQTAHWWNYKHCRGKVRP